MDKQKQVFKANLYSVNDKTGDHYNEFVMYLEADNGPALIEELKKRSYRQLYAYDEEKLVMVRPVGYTDSEFIICVPVPPQ